MRFQPIRLRLLLTIAICGVAAEALAVGITATVNRREATMEDQIVLQITVEGSQLAEPMLPEMPDFDVHPRGQSSQFQIINGQATSSVVHNFILIPRRTGTFNIGSATVEIDGTTYSSRPFSIRILEASAQPEEARHAFLAVQVSTAKPYVGQQVVFTWRFYRRVQVAGANIESIEFPGFLVEDLGELREYQTVYEGQQYVVSEFRKALFPQEEGLLTIPPSALRCQLVLRNQRRRRSVFDEFFGSSQTQPKLLRSRAIQLEVKPLPEPPSGFSGLVGQFDISADVSKRNLQVGESTTLSISISGTGNARMISQPAVGDLDRFKVYDDQPSSSIDGSGNALRGSKTFTKALVPLEAGELRIPAVSLTYFNPSEGSYRTARSRPVTLAVSPADGQEELRLTESLAPSAGKVAVRILADDILPIARGLEAVRRPSPTVSSPPIVAALLLAPAMIFGALLYGERRRRKFESDLGLRRRSAAYRTARKSLGKLDNENSTELARHASLCLRTYVGDKLGLEGAALTPGEVRTELTELDLDPELIERVGETLNSLETALYGAASVEKAQLTESLEKLISDLERGLRGRVT